MANIINIDLDSFVGKTIYDLKKHILDQIDQIEVSYKAYSPNNPEREISTSLFGDTKDYSHKNSRDEISRIELKKKS